MNKKQNAKELNNYELKKIYDNDVLSIFNENPVQNDLIDALRM